MAWGLHRIGVNGIVTITVSNHRIERRPMNAMIQLAKPLSTVEAAPVYDVLADAARVELSKSSHRELRNIRCEAIDDLLVMRGTVGTFYMKQLAQETVRRIDGVQQIVNLLRVNSDSDDSQ